jgi:hypothetical protein
MSAPFRDDAVWRQERAAELHAALKELEATLADAEARIRVAQRSRLGSLFAHVRSVVGISFILVALVGGYVVGRYVVGNTAETCR